MPQRIAGLDGLRAVAVIGVILFHARIAGADLGWAGVQLFFVLSGFLITGILLEARTGRRYLRRFYARRALRILPIYYVVIGLSTLVGWALTDGRDPLAVLPYYVFYVQNYHPQIPTAMLGGLPLTGHTWTLAVEEQFYWLWPLVVLFVTGRALVVLLVTLILAAPIGRLAALAWTGNPYATIATLPAQVDALAMGALLGVVWSRRPSPATLERWGLIGASAGAIGIALLSRDTGLAALATSAEWALKPENVLLLSFLTALFGGLVALTLAPIRPLVRILSLPPLDRLGRISYGVYIYAPLGSLAAALLLGAFAPAPLAVEIAGVALTCLIAAVSWRYLESPILRLKRRV